MIMNREELINAALEHQSEFETCDGEGTLVGFANGMHKQSYESFIAGAEWVLKEMSDHIRNNMSYNDKAWDILPFIEMIKGNSEPYIDYLRNKKAEAIQDIDMNVIQQNISDIKE